LLEKEVAIMETYDLSIAGRLFEELLEILTKYGDYSIRIQKKVIIDILDAISSDDMNEEQKFAKVKRKYLWLYPLEGNGGLSNFYIRGNNAEERKELNKPLFTICNSLFKIFQQ
jgi:hypothetical protein